MHRMAFPAIAPFLTVWLSAAPAPAVPLGGAFYQSVPNGAGNIQAVAEDGVLQVDYVPTVSRPSGIGSMQLLQAAARIPVPLLDGAFGLRGLIGYHQQWAYYDGGAEDTYGGIDAGLSASLQLGSLPYVGDYLKPVIAYGYSMQNRLITAKAQGTGFATGGLMLPSYGAGLGFQLPTKGILYLGMETWSVPMELGTGTVGFSTDLRTFDGLVLGYRW